MNEPSETEQLVLIDPEQGMEARAARRAQRLGELPVHAGIVLRGRKQLKLGEEDELFPMADAIAPEQVDELGIALRDNQPLFNQYTSGYRVGTSEASINEYCMGGNSRNKQSQPRNAADKEAANNTLKRQTLNIGDKLREGVTINLWTARVRRESLKATRYLIAQGKPLDEQAVHWAADALLDFGDCIRLEPNITRGLSNKEIGKQIMYIGEQAVDNPEILRQNQQLLYLAQTEQRARDEYWSEIDIATKRVLVLNSVTKETMKSVEEVGAELERLRNLCKA